jgi:hypothetical protein
MMIGILIALFGLVGAQAGIALLLFQIGSDLWKRAEEQHKELMDEIRKLKEKE